MKRWIHAATDTYDGWKHSYDSERSCSFDSKEFDDGVANIRSFDNDGDWGYSLTLEFDSGKTISKSEYGEGSLQRLKEYAENEFSAENITDVEASVCSFEFDSGDEDYDYKSMKENLVEIFLEQGVTPIGVDFQSVEYPDGTKSQGGVDFEWKDDYDSKSIEDAVESYITSLGYDFLGIDFYSLD